MPIVYWRSGLSFFGSEVCITLSVLIQNVRTCRTYLARTVVINGSTPSFRVVGEDLKVAVASMIAGESIDML